MLAAQRQQYIDGLTWFRGDRAPAWIEQFATSAARAANLAARYLTDVLALQDHWRNQLRASVAPRSDAAAWRVIDALPGHPVITIPVAAATTSRSKAQVGRAVIQLQEAGVLAPLQDSARNRSWEAVGLLDILTSLESGT